MTYQDTFMCTTCLGEGEVVTCIDDICRGSNECIHGDGMSICLDCKGRGEHDVYPDEEEIDWGLCGRVTAE